MFPLLMKQITPQPEYNICSLVNEMYMGRGLEKHPVFAHATQIKQSPKDTFFH